MPDAPEYDTEAYWVLVRDDDRRRRRLQRDNWRLVRRVPEDPFETWRSPDGIDELLFRHLPTLNVVEPPPSGLRPWKPRPRVDVVGNAFMQTGTMGPAVGGLFE